MLTVHSLNSLGLPIRKLYLIIPSISSKTSFGFFKDHDELYWNVTGNGWEFPIEHAAATIKLPGEASSNMLSVDAYTCPQGAKGNDFTSEAEVAGGGSIFIKLKEISCRARNNISN